MDRSESRSFPSRRVRDLTGPADRPILVLGASGFVGGATAAHLRDTGREVIGTSSTGEGVDLACEITDPASVERAITESGAGTIVLAAGMASVADAWEDPERAFRVNTAGTFHVLEATARLVPDGRVMVTSSAGVYGPPDSPSSMPFTEDSPAHAVSPYAASKAASEVLCHQFTRQTGLVVAICRIFNQVGPGQSDAQAPAEFSREIALAEKRGEDVLDLPVGNPRIERDFIDVRDTARAFAELIDAGLGGTFNVCSGGAVSLARIVGILDSFTDVEVRIQTDPGHSRAGDIPRVYGSNTRLGETTGWRPRVSLETSLADLLEDWRGRV
jgi:GDP-4-dehydro-6-deoxy-D-mannose reductase